jgi:hypothetical protein
MADMKNYMAEASKLIKDRKIQMISTKQQFAMTSVNNLALLLSDVLANMQEKEGSGKGSGKGKSKKKGKGDEKGKGLGKAQQELGEKMKEAQKGSKGKGGYSEELAKMAAEQSRIRQMLQQMLDNANGTPTGKQQGDKVKDIIKKMEENENDIVNKRINQQTINRQNDLVTRLMESEKALREQEEDNKRKSEAAKQWQDRKAPPAFEQYIKDKQKQTELLRTVPPNLNPYYKKEVDKYFKKIEQ